MKHSIAYALAVAFVAALTVAGCSSSDTTNNDGGTTGGNTSGGNTTPVTAKFSSLYGNYFQNCKGCHTPTAAGRTNETEKSLDFSTEDTAYTTLSGTATGLVGNNAGCNGQKFIVAGKPAESLVVAALDQSVRTSFTSTDPATCDSDAIADMTAKVGSAPSAEFLSALKEWITAGAQKN
jgi:hypothetical protein